MIRVNLIPHRIAFRQKQIIEYITVTVSAILFVLALVVAVDVWSTQELTDLQAEQASLRAQNAELRKKTGELSNLDNLRKEVVGKLQIVDELQAGRFRSLNTLDGIAEAIPQNIWITKLDDKGGAMALSGFGESSQAVANFMRALQTSLTFSDVRLTVDQEAEAGGMSVRKFALTFHRLTLVEQENVAKSEGDEK
ncbi:MAG: PilN domain-containing protein [Ghiorsea sp.]